ncbi:cytoplasmic tRNA 2-thiolation protein 2 [Trapelia coarctata]|nr:cytoplasmic tRNA 2-thiolation protein 2 [Trapelia coarctata]
MPGKHAQGVPNESDVLCARCQVSSATIVVRTEHLCRDCFMNYVGSKIIKRMDGFKVRGASRDKHRRLLLPLSLGVSSMTLLHVLDQQLRTQKERTSRTGYELHVLFVDDNMLERENAALNSLASAEEKYPQHTYTAAPLSDVYEYAYESETGGPMPLENLGEYAGQVPPDARSESLSAQLGLLPSATSRADMIGILRTRLIVGFAKRMDCESILWGDSTTRLAERTLAETAKGRGFSIPWQTADGLSPYGINFTFPMRDLLRKEIVTYSSLTNQPLTALLFEPANQFQVSASSKETTIDDLMAQYFDSVEQNYPSIVANVVRTSGRLLAALPSETSASCSICGLPVAHGAQGLYGWNGDQQVRRAIEDLGDAGNEVVCYGCSRSVGSSKNIALGRM